MIIINFVMISTCCFSAIKRLLQRAYNHILHVISHMPVFANGGVLGKCWNLTPGQVTGSIQDVQLSIYWVLIFYFCTNVAKKASDSVLVVCVSNKVLSLSEIRLLDKQPAGGLRICVITEVHCSCLVYVYVSLMFCSKIFLLCERQYEALILRYDCPLVVENTLAIVDPIKQKWPVSFHFVAFFKYEQELSVIFYPWWLTLTSYNTRHNTHHVNS